MGLYIIIPARYGSSRFPGKPLISINNRPMIQHVIEQAIQVPEVVLVAVATDDFRIAQIARSFGVRVIMTPSSLRTGSDRVAVAAQLLKIGQDDLVVNIQSDQPLLPPEVIHITMLPLLNEIDLFMSTPVVAITRLEEINDFNHVKVVMDNYGNAIYFSRWAIPYSRDGINVTYFKHLGIYVYRKRFLDIFTELPTGYLEAREQLEQLRVLEAGYRIRCVISKIDSPEVDRPEDIERIDSLIGVPAKL